MNLFAYRLALRLLALGLPRAQRTDWLILWTSELWYVGEAAMESGWVAQHTQLAAFCRGALDDVRVLRVEQLPSRPRPAGSAIACCRGLALLAVFSFTLASWLPHVRTAMHTMALNSDAYTITPKTRTPTIALAAVRSLEHRPQHLFSSFAFYQPITRPLHVASRLAAVLRVSRASANLLDVLGTPIRFHHTDDRLPQLILSERAWHTHFAADPHIFGTAIKLGTQRVQLAGIVADQSTPPGQKFEAWLLLPDSVAEALPATTPVFLVGSLASAAGLPLHHERWEMTVPDPDGATDYLCVGISALRIPPHHIFLFTLLLALLSLPATTPLSLGDYADVPTGSGWNQVTVRRWTFLAAKLLLTLPAIYFSTLVLAYAVSWSSPSTPAYLQLVLSFGSLLFALRWVWRDQRARCPVCLGKLSCPARVGQPSRNFLAWNGTELICAAGHGLLHVPELPTSWCTTQRWLHLDSSWSSLFFGPA